MPCVLPAAQGCTQQVLVPLCYALNSHLIPAARDGRGDTTSDPPESHPAHKATATMPVHGTSQTHCRAATLSLRLLFSYVLSGKSEIPLSEMRKLLLCVYPS